MFPEYKIFNMSFHTGNTLMLLSFLISTFLVLRNSEAIKGRLKLFLIVLLTTFFSLVGARLFHVFFERLEHFKKYPELIFTRIDGMTFYGAIILGGGVLFFLCKLLIKDEKLKMKTYDSAALSIALTYTLMRIGCFASGCCWGKIWPSELAVVYYHPRSVMPSLGVPVHPVQLYDAFAGLLIFSILMFLKTRKKVKEGSLPLILAIFYPIARYITEDFRGDHFRGENILFSLSTSQFISVIIFITAIIIIIRSRLINEKNKLTLSF